MASQIRQQEALLGGGLLLSLGGLAWVLSRPAPAAPTPVGGELVSCPLPPHTLLYSDAGRYYATYLAADGSVSAALVPDQNAMQLCGYQCCGALRVTEATLSSCVGGQQLVQAGLGGCDSCPPVSACTTPLDCAPGGCGPCVSCLGGL